MLEVNSLLGDYSENAAGGLMIQNWSKFRGLWEELGIFPENDQHSSEVTQTLHGLLSRALGYLRELTLELPRKREDSQMIIKIRKDLCKGIIGH